MIKTILLSFVRFVLLYFPKRMTYTYLENRKFTAVFIYGSFSIIIYDFGEALY